MSKSYNQLVNELKKANKQIKNLEFLAKIEANENKKTNEANLELLGNIEKLERQLSRVKGRFDGSEKQCEEYIKRINRLNECLNDKNEFIGDLQGQINNLITYCETLKDNHNETASSVNELTQAIKIISKYLG